MKLTVQGAGREWSVKIPRDYTERHEILAAFARNPTRAACALVGLAVPDLGCRDLWRMMHGYDVLSFGGDMFRILIEDRGWTAEEIGTASETISNALRGAMFPSSAEVEEAGNG